MTKHRTTTLHLTNPLTKGPKVTEAQKLLKKNNYFNAKIDGVFGPATANACKRAKYDLGYSSKNIRMTYGHPLDGLLSGTIKLPRSYRIRQIIRRRAARRRTGREATFRSKIVVNAKWLLNPTHKKQEFYAQIRPIEGEHHPFSLPLHFDCSGSITDCYAWSGAKDPNNEGYNGLGYTGTLLNTLHHITSEEVQPGDVGVYGLYPGRHAVLALTHGPDPIVFSMGRPGDPNQYRASALSSIGPLQWLTPRKW